MLVVHARLLPDDGEWKAFIADCIAMGPLAQRGLIFADVTLNGEQRRQIAEVHRITGCHSVAVVTNSLLTRALITTMNWLSNTHRAFAPGDVLAAFDFLGVSDQERRELLELGLRFARELNLPQLEHSLSG